MINSFKELLNEIGYSWEYPNYDLEYNEAMDCYYINKLSITRTEVAYKTSNYKLAPGVFGEVRMFYDFLKSTERIL